MATRLEPAPPRVGRRARELEALEVDSDGVTEMQSAPSRIRSP